MKTGIILPIAEDPETRSIRPYRDFRDLTQAAERTGLDSAWVIDHLLFHHESQERHGVWEGWTIWSALAEATDRIELGSLVLCTAFRNPALLAKMASTLDEVGDGRVVLGLGAGWHQPEFDAFGFDFTHKVDQFEETINIIAPLLREGAVDVRGTYHSANDCYLLPRPERRIPILIAGRRPRMMGLVARYADAYNTCWHGEVSGIDENYANLQKACESEERDFDSIDFTAGVRVAFPELGDVPEFAGDSNECLTGSVDDVAKGIAAYRSRGVSEIIVWLYPLSVKAVELLAKANERSVEIAA